MEGDHLWVIVPARPSNVVDARCDPKLNIEGGRSSKHSLDKGWLHFRHIGDALLAQDGGLVGGVGMGFIFFRPLPQLPAHQKAELLHTKHAHKRAFKNRSSPAGGLRSLEAIWAVGDFRHEKKQR